MTNKLSKDIQNKLRRFQDPEQYQSKKARSTSAFGCFLFYWIVVAVIGFFIMLRIKNDGQNSKLIKLICLEKG
ncbi:hypothetical protein C1645_822130 [Glomus cerebriforme]|uniref:Uncharacterized protein n=1 Tax=Glomus cerebriforme TaxID=658196 RepID=A0A397T4X2_9GLOM|nr:hypothetical protein C1645_822130 [Glomus cerebriforme]